MTPSFPTRRSSDLAGKKRRVANPVAEQHMTDLLGLIADLALTFRHATHFFQCRRQTLCLAGELHRRGIGKILPLSADPSLDQASDEQADRKSTRMNSSH